MQEIYTFPEASTEENAAAGSSHDLMLRMVGSRKTVLEFGCANGYMSKMLVDAGCDVVGVELNPTMATQARQYCEEVVVADLDSRSLDDLLPERKFDVVVFGDVLEHLHDPWRVLDESRHFLAPGGYAVLSIPNVAHGSVRLALLSGAFESAEAGLLDDSHIRFFTHRTVIDLCTRAGYRIESIERTKVPIFSDSPLVPVVVADDFDPAILERLANDPEADTFQFIVKATPLDNTRKDDALYAELVAVRYELETARRALRTAPKAEETSRKAALSEAAERTSRALAELVARHGGGEAFANVGSPSALIAHLDRMLIDLRARAANATADVERLENERVAMTLRDAESRIELANRAFELDLAENRRSRAIELVETASAELAILRARVASLEGQLTGERGVTNALRASIAEKDTELREANSGRVDEREKLLEAEGRVAVAEDARKQLDLEIAQMRVDLADRVFECQKVAEERDRLQAALAESHIQIGTLREQLATGNAERSLAERQATSRYDELLAQLQFVRGELERRAAQLDATDMEVARTSSEFARLGELHRGLSDQHAAVLEALEAERRQRSALHEIFSEYIAFEIANVRHQAATIDTMVATYQTSKWWSVKRFLSRFRPTRDLP